MFRIVDEIRTNHRPISRREWLQVGGIGLSGLTMPQLLRAADTAQEVNSTDSSASFGRAKSVIVIFLGGGPPQHETFDPKPEAPVEVRGGFGTIQTATPGLHVGELMPMTAQLTDRIAVLRAMVTNDNAHSTSGYQMMTGVPHIPLNVENSVSAAPNLAPHWGSLLNCLKQGNRASFPRAMTLPNRIANTGEIVWPGQTGGILGSKYDPWLLTCDPAAASFRIPDLTLPAEIGSSRFDHRLSLLGHLNRHLDQFGESTSRLSFDRRSRQAVDLLTGAQARNAFDLTQETDATRDRYGRTRWAQSVLLARRLVEAGVSLVQINWCNIDGEPNAGSWDTHNNHNDLLKRLLMPRMDQAYSALLTDLADRGMLDETLVLWVGEFGHTPKFNGNAGRDHWGYCFSVALAGGGVRGGVVHGKSDSQAAFPVSGQVEPRDLHATMFHLLGYSAETQLVDTEGRPHPLSRGHVIREIV